MATTRPLSRPMIGLLMAAGLLLAACGSNSGQAVPASPAGTEISSPTGDATGTDIPVPSIDTGESDSGAGSSDDSAQTYPLDMSVRVVNLFIPKGSRQGTAIDVWAGYAGASGAKKLTTVPYGEVSDYFAPAVQYPPDQGSSHTSYTLTFFPAGKSGQDDQLGSQGETSAPGQKLTIQLAPGDDSGTGAFMTVFADALGSSPSGSGFTKVSLPVIPSGKSIVQLNALGIPNSNTGGGLTLSTADGTCVQYIEPDSGQVHDPKSDTTDLTGGTESLPYIVQPGAQVQVNQVKSDEDVTSACHDQPVVPAFDPKLAAGQGEYAFVYGPDIKSAKLLVVPVA